MSAQFLNQVTKHPNANIRVLDAIVDNALNTQDLQINGYILKKHLKIEQQTSPTTDVIANYNDNLYIVTMPLTTPHSTNNFTKFKITYWDTQPTGSYPCINLNTNLYNGTTGLPIVTGKILANNEYEVTIVNVHPSEDLNGAMVITAEIVYFI